MVLAVLLEVDSVLQVCGIAQSEVIVDAFNPVFRMMVDIDDGGFRAAANFLNQRQDQLPVHIVKAKTGLIKYQ